MKLLTVDSIDEARQKLVNVEFSQVLKIIQIPLMDSLGKILARDIESPVNVPEFKRSTVDGYAVYAKDTMGASESIPVFLGIIGEVEMGKAADIKVEPGKTVYVPTGGMIPAGADGVVMVEYCEPFGTNSVAVYNSVAPGNNVVNAGDDILKGQTLIKRGRIIKPQDIGVLASMGISNVYIYRPLKLSVFSSGDELLSPQEPLVEGMVYDINTYAISAEAINSGMEVIRTGILRDREEELKNGIVEAMTDSDIVILSGGSSQGKKDMTSDILDEVSQGGVLTRGIALKPGKPTISAYDRETKTFLFGLPGHPVASLMVFKLLVRWMNEYYTGVSESYYVQAEMMGSVASDPGKTNCQMVELEESEEGYKAYPIFGKSALMTTLTKSHGYTLVERNKEGLSIGEKVKVYLL